MLYNSMNLVRWFNSVILLPKVNSLPLAHSQNIFKDTLYKTLRSIVLSWEQGVNTIYTKFSRTPHIPLQYLQISLSGVSYLLWN